MYRRTVDTAYHTLAALLVAAAIVLMALVAVDIAHGARTPPPWDSYTPKTCPAGFRYYNSPQQPLCLLVKEMVKREHHKPSVPRYR